MRELSLRYPGRAIYCELMYAREDVNPFPSLTIMLVAYSYANTPRGTQKVFRSKPLIPEGDFYNILLILETTINLFKDIVPSKFHILIRNMTTAIVANNTPTSNTPQQRQSRTRKKKRDHAFLFLWRRWDSWELPNLIGFFQEPNNDSLEGITQNLFASFECSDVLMNLFDVQSQKGYKIQYNLAEGFLKEPLLDFVMGEGRKGSVFKDTRTGQLIGSMGSNSMNGVVEILNVLKVLLGLILQNDIREDDMFVDVPFSEESYASIIHEPIPSSDEFELSTFNFNYLRLKEVDQFRSVVVMMDELSLINRFRIEREDLVKWISSVYKNYRNEEVPFHNWYHGFNVAQTMFAMLKKTGWNKEFLTDVERLSLMISCLCHDLDHPGTNNSFQRKTQTPLSSLYENSILENYHIDRTLYLLSDPESSLLKNLSEEDYQECTHLITQRILDTDLALYFKEAPRIKKASLSGSDRLPENKPLVLSALMTAADLNMASKPWEVYNQVSGLLAEEFWSQGDLEKNLGFVPDPIMDRNLQHFIPQYAN
ncbi:PDE6N [Lepeophtheirus salmonis]|uniref:Phosphodiesterase n=1 Tax=Lepeophtheirus salmonis TaxID=72036 RepID=A0A7R8HE01_LEPSM|nr:PDE6N [Lepeophtheirus salmonis]CAF3036208.1 PDE6N [Lepeophtheirus salmonis]